MSDQDQHRKTSAPDRNLSSLLACLKSEGVDSKQLHLRKSGNEYTELNWQWNTVRGNLEPLGYLVATGTSDIQKAINCCRSSQVRVVARSGGHSYVKNGFGDCKSLIVDLRKLNQISVDSKQMTCEIGAGARVGHISYTLWDKGNFLISAGICPTVGIAGLTLGGGYGYFSRLFGLSSDNVIEMEMINAKGKSIVLNNSTNVDLFWALRGEGGGSFGIVTKFKFKMYTEPESIVYGVYDYSFKDFEKFFNAWQELITSGLPNGVVSFIDMEKDVITLRLFGLNTLVRGSKSESVHSIERLRDSFSFPTMTNGSTQLISYSDFVLLEGQFYSPTVLTHFSQLANTTKHNHVYWKKVKSIYVDKVLQKDKIAELKELFIAYFEHASLHIEHYGGAINDLSCSETAFIHRGNNLYLIQLKPMTSQGKLPNAEADSAMKTFYEKSKGLFNHRESYQNYLDLDISDYLKRYYGENLKRLIRIKNRIDPGNVFHHPQSIPLSFD